MTDQLIKTLALSNRGQVSWGSSSCLMARLTPSALWGGHLHAPLLYHCVGTTSTSSELSKQTTEYIVAGLLHENKNQTHWEIMHSNSHNLSSKSQLQTSEPAGGREKVSACDKPSPALHFLWQAITCTPEHLHGRKSL